MHYYLHSGIPNEHQVQVDSERVASATRGGRDPRRVRQDPVRARDWVMPNGRHRGTLRRHEGMRAPLHVRASTAAFARTAPSTASASSHHAFQVYVYQYFCRNNSGRYRHKGNKYYLILEVTHINMSYHLQTEMQCKGGSTASRGRAKSWTSNSRPGSHNAIRDNP